ncbi:DNA replication and repair protein RecF [Bombiscardovia apis]|uniref:DNA replication and repair protein RecF n=1 Tax=Bombiscardovia apis TaxID=2932182 RepID=A0ABN6SEH1_9BIFI|nr:DNA replication/repair protein RecF [Bombiscardovia apis]BDR53893.1 DNA replication and repair protein RecF [Bombiscardovia apis]
MYISRLAVDHYRSWESLVLDLEPGVNILLGPNGLGKTNLVEAVELLSTGSSHRVSSSAPLVQRGQNKATVRANAQSEGQTTTYEVTVPLRGANRGRINGGSSLYMRDLVGQIPSVTFSPEDQRLVTGDPGGRRSFINQSASQLDPSYYQLKQNVSHIAQQRGALLKQLSRAQERADSGSQANNEAALSTLEVWTGEFIRLGMELTARRMRLIEQLQDPLQTIYRQLAGSDQEVALTYQPSFEEVVQSGVSQESAALISQHFQRIYPGELARGQNLIGPQRDDIAFILNSMDAKDYASNGEEWTLALALRLAEYQLLTQANGVQPILVLDDVFAQLDPDRRSQILNFAQSQDQVLITVAAASDVPELDSAHLVDLARLAQVHRERLEEIHL